MCALTTHHSHTLQSRFSPSNFLSFIFIYVSLLKVALFFLFSAVIDYYFHFLSFRSPLQHYSTYRNSLLTMRFKLWSRDTNSAPQPGQPPPGLIPGSSRPLSAAPELDNGVSASILRTLPPEKNTDPEPALQPAADNAEPGPVSEERRDGLLLKTRSRLSSFASPSFDMVSGRTPLSAWHAVAAKVVAANRFRGIGGSSQVEDFKIEELGGKSGHLVFGPVSVFNGGSCSRGAGGEISSR